MFVLNTVATFLLLSPDVRTPEKQKSSVLLGLPISAVSPVSLSLSLSELQPHGPSVHSYLCTCCFCYLSCLSPGFAYITSTQILGLALNISSLGKLSLTPQSGKDFLSWHPTLFFILLIAFWIQLHFFIYNYLCSYSFNIYLLYHITNPIRAGMLPFQFIRVLE